MAVRALKEIGIKLGKKDWDFSKNPCSGEGNWTVPSPRKGFHSFVSCDCSFDQNSTCHVVSIGLDAQNLTGVVPPELASLRHLKYLGLSRNCLSGSIPLQTFMGNRLSGPFPVVITGITTLVNLYRELPTALAKLTNLTDLRISDNYFTGKIPDFISSWTGIKKMQIEGCSLEGPIPSSITVLTNLTDLRISDLRGERSPFPPLSNMKSIKVLILRSCLIQDEIPEYIGNMEKLKTLDLSFNNLTGEIPASLFNLGKVDFIYLTGNRLTGRIPQWILSRIKNVDISYNNFTSDMSSPIECPRGSVNLVESYSSAATKSHHSSAKNTISIFLLFSGRFHSCLKQDFPCAESRNQQAYSFHINCGGEEVTIDNKTKFDSDLEARGASMFYSRRTWAFSSTGNFLDNDLPSDSYIMTNVSALYNVTGPMSELYETARQSPLSLTYYGICLLNGNYTVKLHFAEIAFTNDSSFSSLGRRVFDVYLQGKLVLKDFDIAADAGGPGKPIVKTFTILVTRQTMKIHFYWAGRGTQGIPDRGTYGPLISAISVEPNFKPPVYHRKLSPSMIAGTIGGAVCLLLLILGVLYKKGCLGGKISTDKELRGLDLQTGQFTLRQIKAATRNFNPANKIGEGGFGSVYKGLLSDGTIIAVKQLSSKSKQGTREFVTEVGMISALQHPNLVKLYGCCIEGNQLILVYEYMENNSLSGALFGTVATEKLKLDWATRRKICLGIARGLAYLHEESRLKIVHRDIKTSNVLLDKDLNAKISDFGLARLHEDDNTHISTRIAGTIGYMAPEYAMRGYLTNKADVYSFGIVALEIVSGKSNMNYRPKEDFVYLLEWAYVLQEKGSLLELVDPELGYAYSLEEARVMLNVALLCTDASPTLRPRMSQVVSMLEGQTAVKDLLSDPGFSTTDTRIKAIRSHFRWNPGMNHSMSTNVAYFDSSMSSLDREENVLVQRTNQNDCM
ncbi:Serine/threonine protein kinase [Handroanthus impetiginosus]|uniref:non-specific serine/threonine protein kinase n=1 Tax=Handroanthus impetiginosus TaxID=429701 RepID=A0A2G9G9I4_9LAMI|nr:Serine/threonine protein kinase [Handroanthus impetiginosus]